VTTCTPVGATRWLIEAMDTVFSVAAPGLVGRPDAEELVAALATGLSLIEDTLSAFRSNSEISRWRTGRLATAQLSPVTRAVIAACDDLERVTGGAFSARRAGGYDPTGYVKGWALARTQHRLEEARAGSFCLNGGGDTVVRGRAPHGGPWRVGVAHPNRPGELATIITAEPGDERPLAVATSGTSERGQHLTHPQTGWQPLRSAITVVGSDIALVDAVATAALVLGQEGTAEPARLVENLGLEAVGFGEDGRPWWTPGMTRYALLPA
jgi:thiamine biosynthesis lipoprotein